MELLGPLCNKSNIPAKLVNMLSQTWFESFWLAKSFILNIHKTVMIRPYILHACMLTAIRDITALLVCLRYIHEKYLIYKIFPILDDRDFFVRRVHISRQCEYCTSTP